MKRLIYACIDALFPPHKDIVKARSVTPERLALAFSPRFDKKLRVYSALPYSNESVRAIIRANKYYGDERAAELLRDALEELLLFVSEEHALEVVWRSPLIVPVPSSPKRLRERGYNQVLRVVKKLQLTSEWEWCEALQRHHRESQAHVTKSERRENIAGAFFVPETLTHKVKGRSIILIDDVCESGSTMADAMRALKETGAREVIGAALAR